MEEPDWVQLSLLYFHKGSTTGGAVYAEPFVDVSKWQERDVAEALGKQFSSWSVWKEEAMAMQASGANSQELEAIKTVVKISKKLPHLGNADANIELPSSATNQAEWNEVDKSIPGNVLDDPCKC